MYDAAHAFGIKYKGKPIMNLGDISIISFHATKLFHTIEGGAIVTDDDRLAKKIERMRNFGLETPISFPGLGINGKNCEFHAAMGLCLFPKIAKIIQKRKMVSEKYDKLLRNLPISKPAIKNNIEYNYSFYPIILPNEKVLIKIAESLKKQNIFPRRYFYPSLNTIVGYTKVKQVMPISENISKRILCLPLAQDLSNKEVARITDVIINNIK